MERPTSLLDVMDERLRREGPRECISHVLYVAKVEDSAAVQAHHKAVAAEMESVTGIFMSQEEAVVHYIEAPPTTMITFLRRVAEAGSGISTDFVRVTLSSEDCPSRYFADWRTVGPLQVSDEGSIPAPTAEDVVELGFEMLQLIIKIGAGEKPELCCPSKSRILAYADCPLFFSLAEYMKTFHSPISVNLESEDVWPHQPIIQYEGM